MSEKITVNQLVEEYGLDKDIILKELKKIGVMIFSANQPIDPRFVAKIQSHLKLISNLAQEEAKRNERKRHVSKKKTSRPKRKKPELAPLEGAISRDMTIRKVSKVLKKDQIAAENVPATEEALAEEQIPEAKIKLSEIDQQKLTKEVNIEEEKIVSKVEVKQTPRIRKHAEPEEKIVSKEKQKTLFSEAKKEKVKEKHVQKEVKSKAKDETKTTEKEKSIEKGPKKKEKLPSKPIIREIKKRGKVLKRSSTASTPIGKGLEKNLGLFSTSDIGRKKSKKRRRKKHKEETIEVKTRVVKQEELKKITIPEGLSVKEVAERMGVPAKDLLKNLFMKGIAVNINDILDIEVLQRVGRDMGFDIESVSFEEELFETEFLEAEEGAYIPRPPVVTVMGHVDHGKTTLLDTIRNTIIANKEAGGITQHIGAYMVEIGGRKITFIDTPGHEAFTMMRARGAKVTDIVVLVVAADDGVMPQTVEAVQHAKAAGVPIIVAINKIDKPNANPEKVKKELSELGLIPEEWGGKDIFVEVSAKKDINIDQLLEYILLTADLAELTANPNTKAMGTVIESRLDKTKGVVATLLVQNGTLFERDIIVAGAMTGKIRAMYDDKNRKVDQATPSMPVLVLGLTDVPAAGEKFFATDDAVKARQLSVYRQQKIRDEILKKTTNRITLDNLFEYMEEGKVKELPIILKVDAHGSKEAIEAMLNRLSTEKVKINILYSAVGAINENDILLASASNAIIIGFNVKPNKSAEELAKKEGVEIHFYNVIYNIAEKIKKAMEGLLDFTSKETVIGSAEVRQTFRVPGVGTIAGCYVTDGIVRRDAMARVFRDNVMIYEGKISSLKRFKDDVTEVKNGYECGISLEKFNDIKVDDELQIFTVKQVRESLDN